MNLFALPKNRISKNSEKVFFLSFFANFARHFFSKISKRKSVTSPPENYINAIFEGTYEKNVNGRLQNSPTPNSQPSVGR